MTSEKKQELQHRANILLSFKSLKESIKDAAKETIDARAPDL
jgi:hypothetical protein